MVTGIATWNRNNAIIHNNYTESSQFYSKVQQHEQKHKDDFDNGFGGYVFMNMQEFAPLITGITNATLEGLQNEIGTIYGEYNNDEIGEMNSLISIMEERAYAISDTIAPYYIYQSGCGGI